MRLKKINNVVNILITVVITLVMTEGLLRVILALRIGPDLLLYGTPYSQSVIGEGWQKGVSKEEFYEDRHNVASHANAQKNYSKYFPQQRRSDTDKDGAVFDVVINNHGFRGQDYEIPKKDGVLRVACLGDSSTFGYGNREQETYPQYLESFLNADLAGMKGGKYHSAETINFGIPHMLMENMASILEHEVLPLQPDVVTIYAGMFDAGQIIDQYGKTVNQVHLLGFGPGPNFLHQQVVMQQPEFSLANSLLLRAPLNFLDLFGISQMACEFLTEKFGLRLLGHHIKLNALLFTLPPDLFQILKEFPAVAEFQRLLHVFLRESAPAFDLEQRIK